MSPLTEGILAGVIANAITSTISYVSAQAHPPGDLKQAVTHLLEKDEPLATILQKATASVARSSSLADSKRTEKMRLFMISPDAESIVRQIYGIYFVPEERHTSESQIRATFKHSLALHLGESPDDLQPLSDTLFTALLDGCERALNLAIDKGVLSALEAKSASRHLAVLDELAAIKEKFHLLTEGQKLDLGEILDFEKKFRQLMTNRHGFIVPPHFDAARKLPIADIYVAPKLVQLAQGKDKEPISLDQFVSRLHRAVVLGNPGGGKSTMASKLCHDLASDNRSRPLANRTITPIFVVLRDYGAAKKDNPCSFVQFIERVANSSYQIPPPPKAVEYLLLNGRAAVIFDGLDELLDTASRREITDDIESFCTMYPAVPVLVTSREVGYEQAPLDSRRFANYRLAPFGDAQVADYSRKWFASDDALTPDQQRQKAKAFLAESEVVSDLRSNPLMLGLMCNIYRGESYIPRNRPDVYEKCSTMLFERWDKGRGIFVRLPFEHHISPAMKYLAHWIYSDEKLQAGVTGVNLTTKAADYLCNVRFEDRVEAESAASKFIDFCRGRAWVFTDTGTTKEGEPLYQFTHRTFLEYFTAAHIVRTNARPADLLKVLMTKIQNREWDVVAQLAFQLQNKQLEGAGNELLTSLLDNARGSISSQSWNVLSFAARCLEFIVPSPRVTRDILTACIQYTFSSAASRTPSIPKDPPSDLEPTQLIGECLMATVENRGPIADCFTKTMIEKINGSNEAESVRAAELALCPSWSLPSSRKQKRVTGATYELLSDISNQVVESCAPRISELCPRDYGICFEWLIRGRTSIPELVAWHGVRALFRDCHHQMFRFRYYSPLVALLTYRLVFGWFPEKEKEVFPHWLKAASDAAGYIIEHPTPWTPLNDFLTLEDWELTQPGPPPSWVSGLERDPTPLFFCLAVLALMVESTALGEDPKDLLVWLKGVNTPTVKLLRPLLIARLEEQKADQIQSKMDELRFTKSQQKFIWSWIRRERDLVGPPVDDEGGPLAGGAPLTR